MTCVLSSFLMFQILSPIYLANNNLPNKTNQFITHYNELTIPHYVLQASKSYHHCKNMYTKSTVISQGRETRVEQVALISFISIGFIIYDRTKFQFEWSKKYPFVTPSAHSLSSFHCGVCKRDISCAHQGKRDITCNNFI